MNSSPGSSYHFGAGHEVRDLDGERLGLGGQHVQGQQGHDLLAETVLRFELGAIGPGLELRRPVARPAASVVSPCSATTSPSSQVLGFVASGLGALDSSPPFPGLGVPVLAVLPAAREDRG